MNMLPRGYETSRHVMSWQGVSNLYVSVSLLVSTHLDLVEGRADLGRQWDKEEV